MRKLVLLAVLALGVLWAVPALGEPAPDGSVPWPTTSDVRISGWTECPDGCICTETQICCIYKVCDEWGWGVDEDCYDRCFFWCGRDVCTLSCSLLGAGCSVVAGPAACAALGFVCDFGCDSGCELYCTDRCWRRICTDWDWVFECRALPPLEPFSEETKPKVH